MASELKDRLKELLTTNSVSSASESSSGAKQVGQQQPPTVEQPNYVAMIALGVGAILVAFSVFQTNRKTNQDANLQLQRLLTTMQSESEYEED